MRFSLITINTWKCDGNYSKRLPVLAHELATFRPTFIFCQEVFDSIDGPISTKEYLKERLEMKAYFFPSRKKNRMVDHKNILSFSGLCLFTNHNLAHYEEYRLPDHASDRDRTAQFAIVHEENKRIGVINTHLTHLKGEDELRESQLHHLLEKLKKHTVDLLIICGDLNATQNSKPIQLLKNDPHQFKNIFDYEPTHVSGRCIDYIFYKSDRNCTILNKRIILEELIEGLRPSDHFGLYVDLKLN
ncbi:MAG: endonuclease/exonuclease/phosphatase family protein [Bacteroidota bacterium]